MGREERGGRAERRREIARRATPTRNIRFYDSGYRSNFSSLLREKSVSDTVNELYIIRWENQSAYYSESMVGFRNNSRREVL